jgi:hypothetical protein
MGFEIGGAEWFTWAGENRARSDPSASNRTKPVTTTIGTISSSADYSGVAKSQKSAVR